ncbi:MAG: ribonuclease P protein subunit [Thermoplasmata archaeon]|jgi:ribonuclease P protein subunit POP4|nr:ribonuclease P protein subunit [Thermoplasmata archaeon]
MKSEDFRRREFIGLEVEVLASTCDGYVGLKGRVVDETRNMLTVETGGRERAVPKDCCEFRFVEGGRAHVVSGKDIRFRPEDRIKKVR